MKFHFNQPGLVTKRKTQFGLVNNTMTLKNGIKKKKRGQTLVSFHPNTKPSHFPAPHTTLSLAIHWTKT